MKTIHIAAQSGDLTALKHELQTGISIDLRDLGSGYTPLHFACECGHYKMVKFLISSGASITICSKIWESPLELAIREGFTVMVKMAVAVGKYEVHDLDNLFLLHRAVAYRQDVLVDFFLDMGLGVNLRDNMDFTPLIWACQENHLKIARKLIDHGADVNCTYGEGFTPLEQTAACSLAFVKLLVKSNAKINVATESGSTPLMMACSWNKLAIVKFLICNGANMEQRDCEGRTAIFYSVIHDNHKITKYLISIGANTGLKDIHGNTLDTVKKYENSLEQQSVQSGVGCA